MRGAAGPAAVFLIALLSRAAELPDLPLSQDELPGVRPALLEVLGDPPFARVAALSFSAVAAAALFAALAPRGRVEHAAAGLLVLADPLAALAAREGSAAALLHVAAALWAWRTLSSHSRSVRRWLGVAAFLLAAASLPADFSARRTMPPHPAVAAWEPRFSPSPTAAAWLHESGWAPPLLALFGLSAAGRRARGPFLFGALVLCASRAGRAPSLPELAALSPGVALSLFEWGRSLGGRRLAALAFVAAALEAPTLVPDLRTSHRFAWPAALLDLPEGARVVSPAAPLVQAECRRLGRADLDVAAPSAGDVPAGAWTLVPVVAQVPWPPGAAPLLERLERRGMAERDLLVRRFDLYRYEIRRFPPRPPG